MDCSRGAMTVFSNNKDSGDGCYLALSQLSNTADERIKNKVAVELRRVTFVHNDHTIHKATLRENIWQHPQNHQKSIKTQSPTEFEATKTGCCE